ncbi:MAG: cob(I)yrinic acid a,c-diamide adenosyltransferase [Ignavibacteriales bacterium]|nr:MAG: cob(I)yrinic acid a,c-diamide adenosyltransferase [Ignavibacteriales bacterium]
MKIYTKTGDKGKTSLFGGKRVWKDDLRIQSYGTVDELNSILGVAITEIKNKELKTILSSIQHELFNLGSDLASPEYKDNKKFSIPRITESNTKRLEGLIDKVDNKLLPLKNFILPGGLKGAALLHYARTVCRRAEREVISLSKVDMINSEIKIYLNRLSDLLFVLARFENFSSKHPDIEWKK